jgi:transcriptional regulator with XRE-family HTH domain
MKRSAQVHNLNRALGSNLRRIRLACGLTQTEVAVSAGVTRAHINRLENGAYNARLDTVRKLAMALAVEPLELLKKPIRH